MAKDTKGLLRGLFRWDRKTAAPRNPAFEDLVGLGTGASLVSMETSYYERMRLPYTREDMYRLYDELDELAEISGVLWAYAEDACQRDMERDKQVWFKANNKKVVRELEDLYYTTLEIEDWLLPVARDVAKYGDVFGVLEGKENDGITAITDWPFPHYVRRIEQKETGILLGFLDENKLRNAPELQTTNLADMIMKPWEMVHFRNRAQIRVPRNEERWIYGTSILYPVRRSGRRKMLYSDLLFLYRLRNSFDRRVFYVDVGVSDYEEINNIVKRWRRALEKKQYVNWDAQIARITTDPMSLGEQLFWPRRKDSNSSVETIAGNPNVADMADVDTEENSLFAGMRAPKEYFGFGRDGGVFDRDKGLTLKDMRWGRSVAANQRGLKVGLKRIGDIHLAYRGIDPTDKVNAYTVQMVSPSVLETIQNLQAASDLATLGETVYNIGVNTLGLDSVKWREHVLKRFFGFTAAEIRQYAEDPPPDAKQDRMPPPQITVDSADEDEDDEDGDDKEDKPAKKAKSKAKEALRFAAAALTGGQITEQGAEDPTVAEASSEAIATWAESEDGRHVLAEVNQRIQTARKRAQQDVADEEGDA